VNIKVFVKLFGVLIIETSPCSFNQLYDILICTFICSLVQRVEEKDLASRHTKTKENQVEAAHIWRSISFLKYEMRFLKKIRDDIHVAHPKLYGSSMTSLSWCLSRKLMI
jgi:hypothetical protein